MFWALVRLDWADEMAALSLAIVADDCGPVDVAALVSADDSDSCDWASVSLCWIFAAASRCCAAVRFCCAVVTACWAL